jgi:hypothetical protein
METVTASTGSTPTTAGEATDAAGPRPEIPHWLVVVRGDRADLHARLRRSFDDSPLVRVILDRRRAERRRAGASVSPDLRREDRRQLTRAGGAGTAARYRLIRDRGDCRILETAGRTLTRCPECQTDLEFELPRFADPPVRLLARVVHTPQKAVGAQHHVETEAFTPSGRSLLACRILARRPAARSDGAPRLGAP